MMYIVQGATSAVWAIPCKIGIDKFPADSIIRSEFTTSNTDFYQDSEQKQPREL